MEKFEEIRKKIIKQYNQSGAEVPHFFSSDLSWLRIKKKIIEISKYLPKNAKVLDIGCGAGYNTLMLKLLRDDLKIIGFDPQSQEDFWKIFKKEGCNFETGNALHLNYKDSSFDAVVSFGVMEHIKQNYKELYKKREFKCEELRFMQEINRVLKPKGFNMIANLPNKYSWSEFFSYLKGISAHPKKYTKKQINNLINTSGFKSIKVKREFFIPSQISMLYPGLLFLYNKNYKLLHKIDRIINFTLLNFFSQSYFIVCKK